MATHSIDSAMETSSSDKSALLPKNKSTGSKCSTSQWIMIIIVAVVVTNLATNMDRIVDKLNSGENSSSSAKSYENEYDIVIIGAGVAGLSHSYFLSTESEQKYSTLTIERFNRLCGRTHSVDIKHNGAKIHFEMGGMRFSYNQLQQKLFKKLDLCKYTVPFVDTTTRKPEQYYLYRNYRMRYGDLNATNYWQNVFTHLYPKEREWIATGFNVRREIGYKAILEENGGVPPETDEEWDEFWSSWTLKGSPVYKWSEEALDEAVLNYSTEYSHYSVKKSRKYNNEGIARGFANYYKALQAAMNQPNDTDTDDNETVIPPFPGPGRHTFSIGYDAVCKGLYEIADNYEENEYWFESNVIGVDYNDDENNDQYKYTVYVEDVYDSTIINKVYTNHVISTIAPSQLKYLLPYMPPIDTQETRKLADSTTVVQAYKISFIYDSSFWIDYNLTKLTADSSTDLEIYSFYLESAWTNGTLTTFHMYSRDQDLWHKLQSLGDEDLYEIDENLEIPEEDIENVLISSKVLVDEVVKQLRLYLNVKDIPYPLAAFSSPFGYNISNNDGYYEWKAGTVPEQVMSDILRPVEDEDIFIASSSYSAHQSWQYGAIWAAQQNLKQNFGLDVLGDEDEACDWDDLM